MGRVRRRKGRNDEKSMVGVGLGNEHRDGPGAGRVWTQRHGVVAKSEYHAGADTPGCDDGTAVRQKVSDEEVSAYDEANEGYGLSGIWCREEMGDVLRGGSFGPVGIGRSGRPLQLMAATVSAGTRSQRERQVGGLAQARSLHIQNDGVSGRAREAGERLVCGLSRDAENASEGKVMNIRQTMARFELAIQAGGPGSGCTGENCGRKVGTTPDQSGKIPVPADIAKKGAEIADRLLRADNRTESAGRQHLAVQYNKANQMRRGPKAAKEIAQAKQEHEKARNDYFAVRKESEAFEKEHGLNTTNAWEAHNGRSWPNYRVNTKGGGPTHYVPKE